MYTMYVKPEDISHHGVTSKSSSDRAVLHAALTTGRVTTNIDLEHRFQGVACPAKMSLLLEGGSCRQGW